uniref:Secreted protein n=1 Tax=Anopheles maculatus TaxID=74869 RepID=A0A182T6K1_9DIPT
MVFSHFLVLGIRRCPCVDVLSGVLVLDVWHAGLSAQTDTTSAAAASLLAPISLQNLVTLAGITQPSLQTAAAAAAQTPATAISNAATSLCKYILDVNWSSGCLTSRPDAR